MHPHHDSAATARRLTARAFSNGAELTKDYWIESAKAFVQQQVTKSANTRRAKNVIMFLGDGMSHTSIGESRLFWDVFDHGIISCVTAAAARVVLGGENFKLSFESFPHVASSKTYCVNAQVADSACSATAFLHGVKTNNGLIGLNAAATRGNCNDHTTTSKFTHSIAKWFQDQGRSAGVVTTTTITHATPAGIYAHTANRDWEGNAEVTSGACDHVAVDDIAEQLVHGDIGSRLRVVLGGGSQFFVNTTTTEHGAGGKRTDGKNLIDEWLAGKPTTRQFVRNREQLMAVDGSKSEQLFGLFSSGHLPYQLETNENGQQSVYPTLAEMTSKAIDVLSSDDDGYFLLVEGGRIDHGHHAAKARLAIGETVEFHHAVRTALERVNLDETLVVVTADHSHTLSLAGYSVSLMTCFWSFDKKKKNLKYL
jgi:alkaline phosphatase